MKAAVARTPAKKAVKKPRRNPLAAERIAAILDLLAKAYPQAECALHHSTPWELLVATILSA
jgi:endonuclease III